jgi:L-threonylcarbamoyladenylate synthase
MILDAGPTAGGLESTVLDLTVTPPRLLRPGLVTPAQLEAIIGPIDQCPVTVTSAEPLRSPGMHERHYAPRTPLECVEQSRDRVVELCRQGLRVGWVTWRDESPVRETTIERLPADAVGYAASLYAALHRLDQAGVERIIVEQPPHGDAWLAVHDRLRRATT